MKFEDILSKDGQLVYTFKGTSMKPFIKQGRDILIISNNIDKLKIMDIVLFKRPNGQYVLHRIHKINNDKYYILGDNTPGGEFIDKDQILGRLIYIRNNKKTTYIDGWHFKLKSCLYYIFLYPIKKIKWTLKQLLFLKRS